MTQKYKKNNSPTIQNGIFSDFPDVFHPDLSGFPDVLQANFPSFPDVSQPNFPGFPGVLQPDSPSFPDVFLVYAWGQHVWCFKKNMGGLGDEVAHTGYVENISCFRG